MSTLLLFLPPRQRLRTQGRPASAVENPGRERDYDYLLTHDGVSIAEQGRRPAARLPRASEVVAIAPEADLAWRRITLPRAGRQMRSALAGLLEETLLEEPERLHFALEPGAQDGHEAWVAVSSLAALAEHLEPLEAQHVAIDRVVPLSWPGAAALGHFYETGLEQSPLGLRWSHPQAGVGNVLLGGSLARQLLEADREQGARWTATPAAAAQAEHWLGGSVELQTEAQRALAAAAGPWNLRQFELAPRTRGIRALRQLWQTWLQPQWRPVRWGVAGLLLVQLLGLNVQAWQQGRALKAQQAALGSTLSASFPEVRPIVDAPVQMRRAADGLRAAAGRPGAQDFETLLAAAATAWPAERGPADTIAFEPGRLQLSALGWSEAQIAQFRTRLRSEGWALDLVDGRLSISPAPPATVSTP
ncbi:MAG: type II secretion system protein GspL [Burkholderiaceae bacterium]